MKSRRRIAAPKAQKHADYIRDLRQAKWGLRISLHSGNLGPSALGHVWTANDGHRAGDEEPSQILEPSAVLNAEVSSIDKRIRAWHQGTLMPQSGRRPQHQ